MTKLDQVQLETVITNGRDHTYRSLRELYQADNTQAMQIDRTLQKLRRKRIIGFRRVGRTVIWTAVPQPAAQAA